MVRPFLLCALFLAAVFAFPLKSVESATLPAVQEGTLKNGIRLLVVERPGCGALHVSLFIHRSSVNTLGIPEAAMELLCRCLGAPEATMPVGAALDAKLIQEDGFWASLQPASPFQGDRGDLRALHANLHRQIQSALAKDVAGHLLPGRPKGTRLTADFLHFGRDLQPDQLGLWSERVARAFGSMSLPAFPLERDRWLASLDAGSPDAWPWPKYYEMLLPTALGGSPYGKVGGFSRGAVAGLRLDALRRLGRELVSPDRLTLVLVGDITLTQAESAMKAGLGVLGESALSPALRWDPETGLDDAWSGKRLQVTSEGISRLYVALRVGGAARTEDRVALLMGEVLAGGPTSRLWRRLVAEQRIAQRLSVHGKVPGAREAHLVVLEFEPAFGRTLPELEHAVKSELARLSREGVSRNELRDAHGRRETEESLCQDDGASLAYALGEAHVQLGQWQGAFPALALGMPDEALFHETLRGILAPSRVVYFCQEPDALLTPQDSVEARLIRILGDRVGRSLGDPAAVDAVVRESVVQLRLLTPAERARLLALLEGEVR